LEIKIEKNSQNVAIIVVGNVRSNSEVLKIKSSFEDNVKDSKSIRLIFNDSYIIPSSLIGFLLKLIHENHVKLNVEVRQDELYNLLERLNLIRALNIIKSI